MNDDIINKFKERLEFFEKQGIITRLYRGVNIDYLSEKLKSNDIEELGKRLFFIGEKPNHCWNDKDNYKYFEINQVDTVVFEYIFNSFSKIKNAKYKNINKVKFINNNKTIFNFFVEQNKQEFINSIKKQSNKLQIRNYYFSILHQLGDENYTDISFLVSSTLDIEQAKYFSGENNRNRKGIIINFWDKKNIENNFGEGVICFKGKPFKRQKEVSLFGGIFPHYIYSFEYNGKEYFNPALYSLQDDIDIIDCTILFSGFDINQNNFTEKVQKWSSYVRAISKNEERLDNIELY